MSFAHPLALLVLAPLALAVALSGWRRLSRLPWLRALITLLVRLAICLLLIGALADPQVTRAASGVHVVFVVDRSAAVGAAGQRAEDAWVQRALQAQHADDSAALVHFGGTTAWSGQISGTNLPTLPPVDPGQADIESGLRLALAGLPADRPSRLVLLSTGRQTHGDALLAAQEAANAGVPISVVSISQAGGNDVAVTTAELPPYARSNEHVTLRIGLHASHATQTQVRISVDGVPLGERTLTLHAGLNSFFFAQTAGAPGVHTYHVEAQTAGDTVPQNDALDAAMVVGPAARVLVLAGNTAEALPLAGALKRAGEQVTILPARQAPTDPAALSPYDAAVLADVPAADLSPAATSALQVAVHDRGRGLLVTGGPHSFAVGGYADSKLETLLPVTSLADAHAAHNSAGLILIIDKSGSMMDLVRGVSKISMAQQAAIDAIAHLQPNDQFGVLAFNDTTSVVAPFGPVGNGASQARTRAAVLNLQAFGDTRIYPALRQAARDLFASHAVFKHVVLMTDGQGETAPFLSLIKLMHRNNITLSTIAIGTDAEQDELRSWANTGGGRFYYVADPHDIPRLVVLETRISSGPTRVQGTLGVHQGANAPALRSFVGQTLPVLHAYNITAPRPNAQVLLQSYLGDPILSQWQDGLGRVAVWTGGTSADWARSWLQQTSFWSDLLHSIMPNEVLQLLQPDLQAANGVLQVGADAYTEQGDFANLLPTRAVVTRPDGQRQTVSLLQDAPGHYSASLPAPAPGVYQVQIAQYDNSVLLRKAVGALAVPYPAAYAPEPADQALLNAIAATANAPTLNTPADAFSAEGLPAHNVQHQLWPLLALLSLLLFPIDVAMRVLYTPPIPYDPARFGSGA